MRFSSYINNAKCLEWGLNANQGALFDLLNQASGWAREVVINGTVYYWVSRNEVISELPLFYSKPDTVYRHFVELGRKDLIDYLKVDGKDLIRLTPKGKTWNEFNSEINPKTSDLNPNNSEIDPKNSDLNPNNSEIDPKNSDLNPTNNITNNNIKKDLTNVKSKKATPKPTVLALLAEFGITDQLAEDFIELRKVKKAPITQTVLNRLQTQADIAKLPLVEVVAIMIDRNWTGFNANWDWKGESQFSGRAESSSKPKFSDENTTWWKGRTIEIYGDTL